MENIKKAVESQLELTENAVIEAFGNRKVQLYIATLNAFTAIKKELYSQMSSGNVDEELRRKFVVLKKGKDALEERPEVKMYLAILQKHAQLADSYYELESTDLSR